jgi:hypothetical protein
MTKRKSRERDGKNSYQPVLADAGVKPTTWPKSAPPPYPLNDEDTQRILDKVGSRFVPHGLELGALRDDLLGCYTDWCSLSQLTSDKIARQWRYGKRSSGFAPATIAARCHPASPPS